MNKYKYHGRHGTRIKQQTNNEVVSTTIMESVIPEQNSRQKNEVLNKYNYHRMHGTIEKHQTRRGNE